MKKEIILLFCSFFVTSLTSIAQDIIYKKDGSKEEAKIVLVGEKEIQYKKFSNPDGPVFSLGKDKIALITYENGEYEIVEKQSGAGAQAKQDLSVNFARNAIRYHLFDVIYGDFTFSYERILSSGTIGIVIPVGFGYAYNSDYFNNSGSWVKNLIYSGLGVNIYPTGQGKWRYFVGPNVRIGYGKQSYWMNYWDENGYWLYEDETYSEGIYTKFYVDNGLIFTPVRNFSISTVVSVGVRYFPQAAYSYDAFLPTASFSVNIGYRF